MAKRRGLSYEEFTEAYLFPFSVMGKCLERDINSIRKYYFDRIRAAGSIQEMRDIASQFRWLARDSVSALDKLSEKSYPRLRYILDHPMSCAPTELAPILVPHIMLQARLISDRYLCPEYIAAFQYAKIVFYPNAVQKELQDG